MHSLYYLKDTNMAGNYRPPKLNKRLIILVVRVLAKPPEFSARLAKVDACPNLSHLEKAMVFVIVNTNAIATSVNHNGVNTLSVRILIIATTPSTIQSAGCA